VRRSHETAQDGHEQFIGRAREAHQQFMRSAGQAHNGMETRTSLGSGRSSHEADPMPEGGSLFHMARQAIRSTRSGR
jgi:hypothetical protein